MNEGSGFAEGYAIGRDSNYNNNNGWGGFGGDGAWWIILLLIFGWNNNGFGGGFGGGNNMNYEIGRLATTNDVASGFSTSTIMSTQRDSQLATQQGFADVQQTLCQGFSGINQSLMNGFHGVDNAICNLGFQNQAGFNSLSHQLSDCCCKLERGIDSVNYNAAKNTCEIIGAINAGNQRLVDIYTNDKIDKLRHENTQLTNQLSQNAQTNTIINTLRPVAQPAYITCSPYESAFGFNKYNNSGCGCGCL